MDEKLLLRSVMDLYEMSIELAEALEKQAVNALRLSCHLYQVFERINPVESNSWDEDDTWEDYRERTIKYIMGGK